MSVAILVGACIIADAIMNAQGLSIHWSDEVGKVIMVVFAFAFIKDITSI